ncbi:MAG: FkbM family methyltransferase [Patescibacteria group bacterium]
MAEKKILDIIQALSSKRNKNLFRGDLLGRILRRKLSLQLLLDGELSVKEAFWSFLPGHFRPKKLLPNGSDFVFPLLKRFFGDDHFFNPVDFFGYKLNYLPLAEMNRGEVDKCFSEFIFLIEEIVIADQYCVSQFINEHSTVIDIGANIGIFSLFTHHLFPDSEIYAFEPTAKTFDILQKTIIENDLSKNIRLFNMALGDENKEAILMRPKGGIGIGNMIVDSGLLIGREKAFVDSEKVPMTTLDKFIQEKNIKKVDFIKVDAEGYEKQIIKGAKEVIQKFSPVIACSAYHLKDDEVEIPKLILSANKNYNYRLENRGEKDLIFWPKK